MNPSSVGLGSSSAHPASSISLPSLSINSVQSREQARKQVEEYQKRIDWHGARHEEVAQRQAYEEAVAFLESVRNQGYFSEQEINTELQRLYHAHSLFERDQGNAMQANSLAEKAVSLSPSLTKTSSRKHGLDRQNSAPFHYAKGITPACLNRPPDISLDPEFEALIQGIQQINFQRESALFLNVSPVASSAARQSFNWSTSPDEIKETSLLASYLREGIQQPIPPQNLSRYEALAERVLRRFEKEPSCTLSLVQEVLLLVQATHNQSHYRRLIDKLQISPERTLNMAALQGLTLIMQHRARLARVTPDSNLAGDCTKLLDYIHQLLVRTHRKDNALQLSAVLQTVSVLLNTMFEAGLKLEPATLKGSLEESLTVLDNAQDPKSHMDESLAFQAKYALQALKRLRQPREWQERLWDIVQDFSGGAAYAVGAFDSKDPDKFWEAINRIGEGVKKIKEEWAHYYKRQEWYLALSRIDKGIELGYLNGLEPFIKDWTLPKKNYLLQGLCFRLERMALSLADENAKKWALSFLKSLEQGGTEWGRDRDLVGVKACASATLKRIGHFWRLPSAQLMERVDYAPPAWHPFWQGTPQSQLLNEVQEKSQQPRHIQLLPVINDGVVVNSTKLDVLRSNVAQATADVTQINVRMSVLEQHLLPTLSSDWLPNVKAALAEYYKPALKIERISGKELDLADCYINLAIVEGKEQQEADKAKLKTQASTFYRPSSYEEIKQTNLQTPIPLEALFGQRKLRNGKEGIPQRILIEGRGGIGKTTLCKKVAHLTQQGLWQDRFDAVLWVPLRQLKTYGAYNLEELLIKKYFSQHPNKASLAAQFIRHTDRVLFILDGLDEVATELGKASKLGDFLGYLLAQPQLIVTSRPAGVNPASLETFDLELETIGFSQENVRTYLEKVEPLFATEILAVFESNSVMRGLANIPVQLEALCYVWPDVKDEIQKNVTMTMLYQAMVDKLWCKDAERLNKAPESLVFDDFTAMSSEEVNALMADERDYLSYLSFRGQQENLFEFEPRYLNKIKSELNRARGKSLPIPLQRHLKQTSFLHTADADLTEDKRKYHFLHLTFQEFFAAKFLANHLHAYLTVEGEYKRQIGAVENGLVLKPEALQDFVNQHKYDPRYQIVWWMVAGLLEEEALEGLFHLLEKEPHDLLGGAHLFLIMHCLHEARTRLSQPTIDRLEKMLEEGLQLERELGKLQKWSQLGSRPAFPEHLLLKFIKQHPQYQEQIFETLKRRPTLSNDASKILIEALQGEDIDIIKAAVSTLGSCGRGTEPIQQALMKALEEDEDFEIKQLAAEALGPYGRSAEPIQRALMRALKEDENHEVRQAAIEALGPYAGGFESIQQAFVGALEQDKDFWIRRVAAEALAPHVRGAEPVQQALMKALKEDEDTAVRQAVVEALAPHAGSVEQVQRAFIRALKEDEDTAIRQAAAKALAPHAGIAEPVQQALIKALKEDKDSWVKRAAIYRLGFHAGSVEPIQRVLIKALEKHEDSVVRHAVVEALAPHVGIAESVQQALIKALEEDKDSWVKRAAIYRLGFHAGSIEPIQRALIKALEESENAAIRQAAAKALSPHAGNAKPVQQALIKALKEDKDSWSRHAAADAIAPYAGSLEIIQQPLIRMLEENKNAGVRRAAVKTLSSHAGSVELVQQALMKALENDEDSQLRREVAEAIAPYAGSLELIQKPLVRMLEEHKNSEVKQIVADVLGPYAGSVEPVQQALMKALKEDENYKVKQAAAYALVKYSINSKNVVDALLQIGERYIDDGFLFGKRPDQGYLILPNLSSDQLEKFYAKLLLPRSYQDSMPLYYQDKALHFYTSTGPGKPIPISDEQFKKLTQAFEQTRKNTLATFLSEEIAFNQKHLIDEEIESEDKFSLTSNLSFMEE